MKLPAISFDRVSKAYGEVIALNDVSFSVGEGEVLGFLGPNGAGKTTAIRILFDLIRPSSGTASVCGLDCQRNGVEARGQMGYLAGDLRLYESMAGKELVDLFASMRANAIDPRWMSELKDRLDVDLTRPIGGLSKGNKQKLGILVALMHKPKVLVLDEPTSGLDPLMQEAVEQLLSDLASQGHTVFFSSHMLAEVERICHRVVIIRRGRIVAIENVGELKGRSLHIIEVTFARPVPVDVFAIEGVRELRRDGLLVHLEVRSNLDTALKAIAGYPVVDLRTEQPSLEDIFLAYYENPAPQADAKAEALSA